MKPHKPFRHIVLLVCGCIATARLASAQMVDPSIDKPNEPFCYFSMPTDVIGVMDGKEGTLVSPEGYFYTGWGELMLFTGNPPVAIHQRVKTLYKGYLPIIQYHFDTDGIGYAVTAFAATLDGNPESPLINFIRVAVTNNMRTTRTAFLSAGVRYEGIANTTWGVADNRFGRPAKAKVLGEFEQAGVAFSRDWFYAFGKDVLLRDSAVVYLFPASPTPTRMMTLKMGYNEPPDTSAQKLYVYEQTPVGIVQYPLHLKPGETQVLEFRMPYEPISMQSPVVQQLREARFDDYMTRTVDFWEKIFARGIDINVPEDKVVQTFKANLVYDLIARNKQEGFYIQKVNEFNYDAFWLRDASFIVRMYDISGYHDFASQCLDFFPRWQREDGNFVSQGGQYDGWGQTLWAYGQHYRMTGDKAFAQHALPAVRKAVEWLRGARASDPLHLIPKTTPGDNEDISGHVTGHNFWAFVGLKNAIALAQGVGTPEDVRNFTDEYDDLFATFTAVLKRVTARTGGYMPPGLDTLGGQDWGNMLAVYPEIILDPFDPMVTATLKATRAKYQEGIMTYGDGRWLHHYLTMKNTETEIVRGDQQMAVEELYALLVHTGSTHAGFEFSISPWGTRDFGMNLSPHGWFAAKFRACLRDMLVREQGKTLHLLSVLSPSWMKPGDTVSVQRAPTTFGTVNYQLVSGRDNGTLTLNNTYDRQKPDSVYVHLPWFVQARSVTVDGRPVPVREGILMLPADARRVEFHWTRRAGTPDLSYRNAVEQYKKEYRRRYEAFLQNGK